MSPTLLCADADRDLGQILARALGVDGCRVAIAHSGDQALQLLREHPPDVAILDVGLPGPGGGLGVLRAMRRSATPAAKVPVILWSEEKCSAEDVEQARVLGASALLRKPVKLEALLARVTRLLASRRGEARAGGAARAVRSRRASLRGRLSELPFAALLHQAHGLRANGVLHLRASERRKEVELRDGRPSAVRSNLPSERLGDWLLRAGRIEPAVLAESARRLLRGEGLQGQILVGMQVLSEEDLATALREQAEDKLLEIFEWTDGEFALAFGAKLGRATALPVSASAADVIRQGVRTRAPLARIDAILRCHEGNVVVRSANPFYSFQEAHLADDERALLRAGEKGFAARALFKKSEAVRRAAYGLLETGLLELRDGRVFRRGAHAPVVRLHSAAAPERDAGSPQAPAPDAALRSVPDAADAAASIPDLSTPTSVPVRSAPAASVEDHSHYAADAEQRAALTALLERLSHPSPFERLGVARDASEAELRSAYVALAKETHPDRYAASSSAVRGLAEQAFRELTRTFDMLSDPQQLAAYRADPERDRKQAEAIGEAERALAAERSFQKGEARLRLHDWAGALSHFERAMELYPEEGEYVAYCGWAYYLTHGHEPEVFRHSFELVKRGAKLAPEREKPYLFLGRLCQAAGRLELSERMFTKAIECRPDSIEALRELRLLQMRRPKRGLLGRLLRRPPSSESPERRRRS